MAYQDALARVIEDVVAPNAGDVDRNGTFPRAALDALGEAGILGLCSAAAVGGGGQGLDAASHVVASLAEQCGSTAMVVLMHYAATAAIEAHGPEAVRAEIGTGRHLSTLAFSEVGSRSHFWAPQSSARVDGDQVHLDAQKSWVTAAGEADSYVWSSRPSTAPGPMTLWLVPSSTAGLEVAGPFDGLGLRGNGSRPMTARDCVIPESARLGDDGAGLDIALAVVLPWFLILNASASLGLMRGVVTETGAHLTRTRLDHLDQTLAQQPVPRARYARMRVDTDSVDTLIGDTLTAVGAGRADAQLRVLEVKASAGDTVIRVTEQGMRICGGAAFRKELGIERRSATRRPRRSWLRPPTPCWTSSAGPSVTCPSSRGRPHERGAGDGRGGVRPEGGHHLGRVPGLVPRPGLRLRLRPLFELRTSGRGPPRRSRPRGLELAAGVDPGPTARGGPRGRGHGVGDAGHRPRPDLGNRDPRRQRNRRSARAGRHHRRHRGDRLAQATLLPLSHLRALGLEPGTDFTVRRFDGGVGLHGDHIGGERDAARALLAGEVDAACMIDANTLTFANEGTLPKGGVRILAQTAPFDHCNMTVTSTAPPDAVERFGSLLLAMSYGDPQVRTLLDLEGLKQWLPGRVEQYEALDRAVDETGFYDAEGNVRAPDYRP